MSAHRMGRRMMGATAALLAAVTCAGGRVHACGDKFLVPGRGIRFQRTQAERQASALLIWAPPTSALAGTLSKLRVVASLAKVGYRATVATTEEELAQAAARRWDVVVADVADAAAIRTRVAAAGSSHVVAVTPKVTGAQLAKVRSEYPVVLRAPSRTQDFLDAIDAAGAGAHADKGRAARVSS